MSRAIVLLCLLACFAAGASGCRSRTSEKRYTVIGQVLAVDRAQHKVTIKHQDIQGFMPGMTMAFDLPDTALLQSTTPGDLVQATLVVGEREAHIAAITRTGHAALETPPPSPRPAVLAEGQPVTDAPFLDQDGRPRRLADFRGHRVVLTFIYTRCPLPNYCPLMSTHFATLQGTIRMRPDLADVRLLSVTLDPAFDRPSVLRAHAELFRADPAIWTFLTGMPDAMTMFAQQFGIYSEVDTENPSQLIHNLQTAVIDPEGRLVHNTHGNEWRPGDILAQLTTTSAPRH